MALSYLYKGLSGLAKRPESAIGAGAATAYGARRALTGKSTYVRGKRKSNPSSGYPTKRRRISYTKRRSSAYDRVVKEIMSLKRIQEQNTATLVYRDRELNQLVCTTGVQNSITRGAVNLTVLEEALAQLRYYDPTAPTSLVTADGASGSYMKEFLFTRCSYTMSVRNNYQVPVEVRMYACRVRADTSQTPLSAWSAGMTDISNVDITDLNAYPTDSALFQELWKVEKRLVKVLNPGEMCSLRINSPEQFFYDPSNADTHSLEYQIKHHGSEMLVVVKGIQGHDTTAAQLGHLPAGIDISAVREFEVKYDGGGNFRYMYSTGNGVTSFTNAGVVSNMPVSDNQSYSVA